MGFVDEVVIFSDDTPINFIYNFNPDIHCNGEEYGTDCLEASICEEVWAELVLVPRIPIWSTAGIKEISAEIVDKTMQILLEKSK